MLNTIASPRFGRLTSTVLLAVAMLGASSCGRFHQGDEVPPAVLLFENQSLDQADVYVIRGPGDTRRIGTVQAGQTETLTVPPDVIIAAGPVDIVARLLARSITPRTGPVAINPGDRLRVTLPPDEKLLTVLPAAQ